MSAKPPSCADECIVSLRISTRWILLALTVLLICSPATTSAQLMINKGATISTKITSIMQVNGAYQNASGSIDDSGTVVVTTNFTNSSPATAGGAGYYYIGGHYTNDGTFVRQTGTVVLNGTGNQNVGGTSITTFYNLQFTNGGTKTLTQKEIVDSNCWFTNGICYTTNTNVLNFTVNGNWVNGSSASYVDGPCEKDFAYATEWRYPVGKNLRFNTCSITPITATPTTFRTEYFNFPYVNTTSVIPPLVGVSKIHYWYGDIVSSNPKADSKIKLYWIAGDYTTASYISSTSGLVVARWNIPLVAWESAGSSGVRTVPPADYISGWVQSQNVISTNYGTSLVSQPFTISTITSDNSLPVELANFSVRQVANKVNLAWSTYSEINNLGFEIERRRVGGEPTRIKSYEHDTALLAKSAWGAHYETVDEETLVPGQYAYELFQRDVNGHRERVASRTIEIREIGSTSEFHVSSYPNPSTGPTHIKLDLPTDAHVEIAAYDVTGHNMLQAEPVDLGAGEHLIPFDLSGLASGTYRVIVSAGAERTSTVVVVSH
jgi:hypothetical protein